MARKYNLGKRSDMRRFERDLRNDVMEQARTAVLNKPVSIDCPNCHRPISVHAGSNVCPFCKQLVELNLNI